MNSVTWVLIDQRLNHLLCEHLSSNLLGVSRYEKYGEDRQDKERDRVKPRWTNLADVPWKGYVSAVRRYSRQYSEQRNGYQ
jgi:hypothetical protein